MSAAHVSYVFCLGRENVESSHGVQVFDPVIKCSHGTAELGPTCGLPSNQIDHIQCRSSGDGTMRTPGRGATCFLPNVVLRRLVDDGNCG